jgi:hypothetical protein
VVEIFLVEILKLLLDMGAQGVADIELFTLDGELHVRSIRFFKSSGVFKSSGRVILTQLPTPEQRLLFRGKALEIPAYRESLNKK